MPAPTVAIATEAKTVAEGVPMHGGYGPGGQSAQVSWDQELLWLSDRELMQRTIQKGKPVVLARDICQNIRRKAGNKGQIFPQKAWEEVMKAGFAPFPVGKLMDEATRKSAVQLAAPPTDDRERMVQYHNMLVDLCRVTARQLTTLLHKTAVRPDFSAADSAVDSRPSPSHAQQALHDTGAPPRGENAVAANAGACSAAAAPPAPQVAQWLPRIQVAHDSGAPPHGEHIVAANAGASSPAAAPAPQLAQWPTRIQVAHDCGAQPHGENVVAADAGASSSAAAPLAPQLAPMAATDPGCPCVSRFNGRLGRNCTICRGVRIWRVSACARGVGARGMFDLVRALDPSMRVYM